MRVFEILAVIVLIIAVLEWADQWRQMAKKSRRFQLPALACVLLVLHVLIEGARWQMAPAYVVGPVLLLLGLRTVNHTTAGTGMRYLRLGGYALLIIPAALAGALAWGLPVPSLPAPGGPHGIGTYTTKFVDPSRKEFYGPDETAARTFMAQVWYPAEFAPEATIAPWWPDAEVCAPVLARLLGFPGFFFNHLALIPSNAMENAPVEEGDTRFPVIIYSHGWTGFRQVGQDGIDRLVSHGYVVIAPEHTYGAVATRFPDGSVYPFNPEALPSEEEAGKRGRQNAIEKLVDSFAGDVTYLVNELEAMDDGRLDSPLKGRLNLDQIGVFGHSTGGGAITEVALQDPRVKAALGYDPWVEPVSEDMREKALTIPYMSILSEGWYQREDGENNAILSTILAKSENIVYDTWLEGAQHNDFTVTTFLSPLADRLGLKGPINGARASDLVCTYTLAFFDAYLRDEAQALLSGPSETWPELHFRGPAAADES